MTEEQPKHGLRTNFKVCQMMDMPGESLARKKFLEPIIQGSTRFNHTLNPNFVSDCKSFSLSYTSRADAITDAG